MNKNKIKLKKCEKTISYIYVLFNKRVTELIDSKIKLNF